MKRNNKFILRVFSRSSAPRLGKHLPQFLPLVIKNVDACDDDELRENCLQVNRSIFSYKKE